MAVQTFRDGEQKIAVQQVEIKQEGDLLQVANVNLGLPEDEGGYYWSGELRLWDNEVLMGWYAGVGTVRSKGTMYFALHPHGLNIAGRWVGLGYDDRIMTGWAAFGQYREPGAAPACPRPRLQARGGHGVRQLRRVLPDASPPDTAAAACHLARIPPRQRAAVTRSVAVASGRAARPSRAGHSVTEQRSQSRAGASATP